MFHLLLGTGVFLADQAAKAHVEAQPDGQLPKELLDGRATLCRSHNQGLMLNLLEDKPQAAAWLSSGAGILALLKFLPLLLCRRPGRRLEKLGGALILGGAASNILDHWRRGYVVDYLKFPLKPIARIAFNLGDLAIFAGCLLAALGAPGESRKERENATPEDRS